MQSDIIYFYYLYIALKSLLYRAYGYTYNYMSEMRGFWYLYLMGDKNRKYIICEALRTQEREHII